MIDTYDLQICDHCGCEFSHSYFSGGTRSCATCKIAYSTAHESHDELVEQILDDDWIAEERYAVGDLEQLQINY